MGAVTDRLRLWLVMLPLLAASSQAASLLLDRHAPQGYLGAELFARSSASYSLLPLVVALGGIALCCSLWSFATAASERRRLPLWVFACLPAGAFAAQEHVEFAVAHGRVPWTLVASPVFLAGLLLQIPFGALAYLAARLLVRIASAIARRGPVLDPPCGAGPRSAPARATTLRAACAPVATVGSRAARRARSRPD